MLAPSACVERLKATATIPALAATLPIFAAAASILAGSWDHAQVWTALQLIHCETLREHREEPILRAGDDDQPLIYLPRFRRGLAGQLRKAVRQAAAAIVYSWQAEVIRDVLREEVNVQVEPVPESLARRFGMKV
jgi:hypothetical protein